MDRLSLRWLWFLTRHRTPSSRPHMLPPIHSETSSARLNRRSFVKAASVLAATSLSYPVFGQSAESPKAPVRVRIWSEGTAPQAIYPNDIDGAIGDDLRKRSELSVTMARLSDPECGLSDAVLDVTDTLIWWGRLRHDDLPDSRAAAIVKRVKAGQLGFVALHGSYASKPFRALFGPSCAPKAWREDGQPERVEIKAPAHPMARGIAEFTIPKTSMFVEPFDVPEPDDVVFLSSWEKGEKFRSGLTWTVGKGRVAYFRPGHDGFPVFFHPTVRQIIANAALWTAPSRPIG